METSIDFFKHFYLHVNALKCFGLWYYIPYSKTSIGFWAGILHRIIMGFFMYVLSTGGQIVYLVRLFTSGNFNILEFTGVVNLVITETLAEIMLLDMRLHRDSLLKLIEQLSNKEFQCYSRPERNICEKAIRLSRGMFIISLFCASLDVFVHVVIVPALEKFEVLPLKMGLIFFDINDSKYFKYIFAYQILYKPCMLTTFVTHKSMPWAAMSFTMSQLDVLIYNFENMKELVKSARIESNCDENEAFRQTFRRLVLHHSSIIRFINIIQETFGRQLSLFLFMSACVIGSTALQFFSIESPFDNLIDVFWIFAYLIIFIGMLFVDCYMGNSITIKCQQLSICVYACSWMDLDISLKKNIIIFMTKTQQPVVITAVKLVPMSLETFTRVMNWTYKGFAVLNQMK